MTPLRVSTAPPPSLQAPNGCATRAKKSSSRLAIRIIFRNTHTAMNLECRFIPTFLLSAALASFLGACATNRVEENVDLRLVDLQLEGITVLETSAVFTFRIQNRLSEPLTIEGGEHKIYLNLRYIGSGVSNETLIIPRLSEGIQTVKIRLTNLATVKRVADAIASKHTTYRIESVIYAKDQGQSVHVAIARRGDLKLKSVPPPAAPRRAPLFK